LKKLLLSKPICSYVQMKGTVVCFYRNRGFGLIKPKGGGKRVLVHWSKVVTDDEWPFIKRRTEVKFELVEKDENGKRSAKKVTLSNGKKIPIYIPANSNRISNDNEVFSGVVKFFDFRKGFGIIKPDDMITWEDVSEKDGVFFSREAIVSTGAGKGMVLNLRHGKRVTFKVYKDKKGLGAHELQNEDGNPLEYEARRKRKRGNKRKRTTNKSGKKKPAKKAKLVQKTKEELLEEREVDEYGNIYTGTVKSYRADKDFGFISISENITLNGITATGKIYVMKDDIICYSDEVGLKPGTSVMFKIYKDSMGLGACDVHHEDGTPIIYEPEVEAEVEAEDETNKPVPMKAKKKTTKVAKKVGTRRSKRAR